MLFWNRNRLSMMIKILYKPLLFIITLFWLWINKWQLIRLMLLLYFELILLCLWFLLDNIDNLVMVDVFRHIFSLIEIDICDCLDNVLRHFTLSIVYIDILLYELIYRIRIIGMFFKLIFFVGVKIKLNNNKTNC